MLNALGATRRTARFLNHLAHSYTSANEIHFVHLYHKMQYWSKITLRPVHTFFLTHYKHIILFCSINCIITSIMICTPRQILFWWWNHGGLDKLDMWHVRRRREIQQNLVGKAEGKRPHARRWRRWENNKVDFREVGWEGVGWIDLVQNRNKLRDRFKRAI